jgi:hypothetical protein
MRVRHSRHFSTPCSGLLIQCFGVRLKLFRLVCILIPSNSRELEFVWPASFARHILEDAAIEGYRVGRLSQRQVGETLGFDYWQTMDWCALA